MFYRLIEGSRPAGFAILPKGKRLDYLCMGADDKSYAYDNWFERVQEDV